MGFAIGRWTGLGRIERVGGTRVTRVVNSLEQNGTLAVFLLRKIPAPFLLANIVAGASRVRYRDFIVGTVLGMTAIVVALAGFGYHLTNIVRSPSPRSVLAGVVFVGIPLDARLAHQPRAAATGSDRMSDPILRPGTNCWRVDRARHFYAVQDAADYFRLVRQALLSARRTVFILGWDMTAGIDLDPQAPPSKVPTQFDTLLKYIVRRRRQLRCYILTWDYGLLFTLERDPFSRFRFGWAMPRQVHFEFDDRHPIGASHHQKIVVIDDQLAFCGGVDLTGHRWDTPAHRPDEPLRKTPTGKTYGPYHEVQAMVDGAVAASLGVLARDRWRALGAERLPASQHVDGGPVAGQRDTGFHRRRRGHQPDDTGIGIAACGARVRGAVPRLRRSGHADDLYREPVLHELQA